MKILRLKRSQDNFLNIKFLKLKKAAVVAAISLANIILVNVVMAITIAPVPIVSLQVVMPDPMEFIAEVNIPDIDKCNNTSSSY